MPATTIWLPNTAKEALCLGTDAVEDIELQVFINQSIVSWLNGQLDTGTLTDIFMQYDIDPTMLDNFENRLYHLIRQ